MKLAKRSAVGVTRRTAPTLVPRPLDVVDAGPAGAGDGRSVMERVERGLSLVIVVVGPLERAEGGDENVMVLELPGAAPVGSEIDMLLSAICTGRGIKKGNTSAVTVFRFKVDRNTTVSVHVFLLTLTLWRRENSLQLHAASSSICDRDSCSCAHECNARFSSRSA